MFTIATNRITELSICKNPPDLLLCPELRDVMMLDFRSVKELVSQGYEYAMLRREEIKRMI